MVIFVLAGCSSSSQEPTTTTVAPVVTTVAPVVATLPPIAATVPPPPVVNTPKPTPTVVREDRRATGYTDTDRHECRHTIYYSDGTSTATKYWVANGSSFNNKWDC